MKNSLVSVIVPCYNQGEFVRECIESVLASTYDNFEIIIVNDGSTDSNTLEVLRNLQYEKTIVVNQENKGLPSARNAGISVAKGKYILPLDADDMIMPTFLEKAVKVLEENKKVGIVGGATELFGDQTGVFPLPKYKKHSFLLRNCLVCSCMFRRDDWARVGGYNPNMKLGLEDWDFWLALIEIGRKVYQFDEVLFKYRKYGITMIGEMDENKTRSMLLRAIDNHPKLYRWRGNYRKYISTGKYSRRRHIVDTLLRFLSCLIPVRNWRKRMRTLSKDIP